MARVKVHKPLFIEDPDAYEWPCDICGKPFKPKAMVLPQGKTKHVPRCKKCCEDVLLKAIFGVK